MESYIATLPYHSREFIKNMQQYGFKHSTTDNPAVVLPERLKDSLKKQRTHKLPFNIFTKPNTSTQNANNRERQYKEKENNEKENNEKEKEEEKEELAKWLFDQINIVVIPSYTPDRRRDAPGITLDDILKSHITLNEFSTAYKQGTLINFLLNKLNEKNYITMGDTIKLAKEIEKYISSNNIKIDNEQLIKFKTPDEREKFLNWLFNKTSNFSNQKIQFNQFNLNFKRLKPFLYKKLNPIPKIILDEAEILVKKIELYMENIENRIAYKIREKKTLNELLKDDNVDTLMLCNNISEAYDLKNDVINLSDPKKTIYIDKPPEQYKYKSDIYGHFGTDDDEDRTGELGNRKFKYIITGTCYTSIFMDTNGIPKEKFIESIKKHLVDGGSWIICNIQGKPLSLYSHGGRVYRKIYRKVHRKKSNSNQNKTTRKLTRKKSQKKSHYKLPDVPRGTRFQKSGTPAYKKVVQVGLHQTHLINAYLYLNQTNRDYDLFKFVNTKEYQNEIGEWDPMQGIDSKKYLKDSRISFMYDQAVKSMPVIGTAKIVVLPQVGFAELINVFIFKKFRGKGFCQQLVSTTVAKYKEEFPDTKILLMVAEENTSAIKCYRKVGFKKFDGAVAKWLIKRFSKKYPELLRKYIFQVMAI